MTEQEKIDQFNRDVDDVLKGNAPQAGTDPQRLNAARQLAAADFSARSRALATTRARLLARANRELPVQNKRKEMNTRFSNVLRTLAFGAFLLMIVFGLGWVLSNTTPQVGVGLEGTPTPRNWIVYFVQEGDTLESISEKTGVSVETIMALNDLAPDALLPVGDRIFIGWQDDLDPLSTEMPGEINAPHFPRQQPGLDQMEAILEGKLIVANGCLRIESFDAPISYLPIWPNGYGLGISSNEIKIADDTGEMIVARVGEGVSMGGGELLSLDGLGEITLQQIPGNCSGPYWLVGAGTHIIPLAPTLFRSEANHLEVTVPDGWAAYEGEEYLASPFTGVVAFNSWGEQGFWVKEKVIQTQSGQSFAYNPNVVLDQIPQDGAYIVLVWQTGGPAISEPGTLNAEYPGSDLSGLWKAGDCREHIGQYLDFYKFERIFRLEIYCGPQASDATVEAANSLLSSWRFDNSQSELSNPQPPTPLTLESDSETIRQRILLSHTFWQALWADAQITDYVSGTPAVQRVQVWVNQPAQARVLSGKADGTPATLWISDGQMTRTGEDLSGYGLENFVPPMTESDTVYPHPMTYIMPTPLSSLLFPSGLAQRGGTYRPIAIETVAGRETLVVEWNRPDGPLTDRFWVDTVTGVILHQQNYGKGGDGALTYDYLLSNIQYDLSFPPETFNRLAAFPPAFATGPEDIFAEVATPMPEGEPDTSLASGEIYLFLEKTYGTQSLGLWHFPAGCLVSGESCPPLEPVAGFHVEFLPALFSWSPDESKMIYLRDDGGQQQHLLFDRATRSLTLFDAPTFWGEQWSPDGSWIAAGVPVQGNDSSSPLLIARTDGSAWQEILNDIPGYKAPVGWLDDHRILIQNTLDNATNETSPTQTTDLQVYDMQSGDLQTLLEKIWNPDETNFIGFTLSPDRTRVSYSIGDLAKQTADIKIFSVADSIEFSFTVPFPFPVTTWSPTGEWLSLIAASATSCEIHLVRPDGRDSHLIFTADWGGACQHVWSPDGQYILVSAYTQIPTIPRLYVINVATGESRLVELPDVGVEFEWPVVSWVP